MAAQTSGSGLKKNVSAALSYVLGPITGGIFLVIEKDPFVRFHAMQSIVVSVVMIGLQWVLGLSIVLLFLVPIIGIVSFVLWLLMIYKAWMGQEWEVPVLGKFARSLVKKA